MFRQDISRSGALCWRLVGIEVGGHWRDRIMGINRFTLVHGRDCTTATVVSAENFDGSDGRTMAILAVSRRHCSVGYTKTRPPGWFLDSAHPLLARGRPDSPSGAPEHCSSSTGWEFGMFLA